MKYGQLISNRIAFSVIIASAFTLTGCGTTGSSVTLQSRGYNVAASSLPAPLQKLLDFFIPSAVATGSSLTGIQLCITQLKLEAEDGSAIKNGDSDLFEAPLGLVDLGNGMSSKSWGDVSIPEGSTIKRLKIEIHRDPELCGVSYSSILTTSGGTVNLTKDIELKFQFSAAKSVSSGDAITLGLTNFVTQLEAAYQAGKLNDEQITSYLEDYASGSDDSAE